MTREAKGRMVREEWMKWAMEQPSPMPSWLLPWEELSEPEREVARRIGERLFKSGKDEQYNDLMRFADRLAKP